MHGFNFSTPLVAFAIAICVVVYFVSVSFISPLVKVPSAHWSSGFSSFWILWQRWRGRELQAVVSAHQKLGPVVRLGPKDLSVSQYAEGVRKIYGGGFEKPGYYDFFRYYKTSNAFSSRSRDQHSFHRRQMSAPYTKSALFSSKELLAMVQKTLLERLLPRLVRDAENGQATEVLGLSYALCLDLVTQFIFGYSNASNFLQGATADTNEWLQHYEQRYCPEAFWSQELPKTTRILDLFGIDMMPRSHATSTQWLEDWMMRMCDGADEILRSDIRQPEDFPIVFNQVRSAAKKTEATKDWQGQRLAVASELFDHMSGAREVLGLVLAYCVYYVSRHPTAQETLRTELYAAGIDMRVMGGDAANCASMPSPSSLDSLPFLSAVLEESFRMRPNSTPLPRMTPQDRSVSLAGYENIPPGTRVNTFQWLVHRDPSKWDAVDEWKPERWLREPTTGHSEKDVGESRVWAFGSGPRMCVGMNLTQYLMRYILAVIFTNFRTIVVDAASFGVFPAGSLHDKLWLKFERLPT